MREMNNSSVLEILEQLSSIPNPPFATRPRSDFIRSYLDHRGIDYTYTKESIVAKVANNPGKRKLIFMTHLDHPGIVLKNQKEGKIFGSVGTHRLKQILQDKGELPIKVFDSNGTFKGKGAVTKITGKNNTVVKIKTNIKISLNSIATWDIDFFQDRGDTLNLYSADNDSTTAALLYNLKSFPTSDYNVYFVFNSYEEVHQMSSYELARFNLLNLTASDIIINLDSKPLVALDPDQKPRLDYSGGLLLQLTGGRCIYGYKFKDSANVAEIVITKVAKELGMPLQIAAVHGYSDGRPFCSFGLTPNISTISIPNEFKHNIGNEGEVVPERIKTRHLLDLSKLLGGIILSKFPKTTEEEKLENITYRMKQHDTITDRILMDSKSRLNDRLRYRYKNVIAREHFFPENNKEFLDDIWGSMLFYSKYLIQFFSR